MVLTNGAGVVVDDVPPDLFPQEDNDKTYYSIRLPKLQRGMALDTVKVMQTLLIYNGYDLLEQGANGVFGEETERVLVQYQTAMNLKPSGACDLETWSALLGLTGVG